MESSFKTQTVFNSTLCIGTIISTAAATVFGYELPVAVGEQATAIFNTILSILVLLGIVIDPTTNDVSDSEQTLRYNKPRDDLEGKQRW